MTLNQAVGQLFGDMRIYLDQIDDKRYGEPLELLSKSSIGQHSRHVIEFFQCLLQQRLGGTINYDQRVRNTLIEEHAGVACQCLEEIQDAIEQIDPKEKLNLAVSYDHNLSQWVEVETTFERELVYNIEHAIHHMAMIKIGLRSIAEEIELPRGFGVAPSTIKYQQQSAR
jgi:hypothetical protein